MPRDGELLDKLTTDPILKTLRAVDARLATEADWCQNSYESADEQQHCIMGAWLSIQEDGTQPHWNSFIEALGLGGHDAVVRFNDAATFPEVKTLLARAISKRMAELETQDV